MNKYATYRARSVRMGKKTVPLLGLQYGSSRSPAECFFPIRTSHPVNHIHIFYREVQLKYQSEGRLIYLSQ